MEETRANSGKVELRKYSNISENHNHQDKCVKYGENKEEVDTESTPMELFMENKSVRLAFQEEMRQLREGKSSLREALEICGTVEGHTNTMEETRTNRGKSALGKYTNTSTNLNQQDTCVKYGENKAEVDAESNPMEPYIRNEPVRLPLKEEMRQLREENSILRKDRKKFRKFEKQVQTIEETRINSGKVVLGKHTNISANLNQQYRCVEYGESKEEADAESYPMELYIRSQPVRPPLEKEMRQLRQENLSIRADVETLKNLEGQMKLMKETLSLLRQDVDDMKKSSASSRTRTLFAIFFCVTIFFARFSLCAGCP